MRFLTGGQQGALINPTSWKKNSANFAFTAFYEVQLREAECLSVRRVMSSSCSQPSPTKE